MGRNHCEKKKGAASNLQIRTESQGGKQEEGDDLNCTQRHNCGF